MPARLPGRSASTRLRSPAPARGRPKDEPAPKPRDDRSPGGLLRPSHSVRSRSHDGRRADEEVPRERESRSNNDPAARRTRRRRNSSASSASSIDAPRARIDTRSNDASRRRRPRSPDSVSPQRPMRTRHASVGHRSPPPSGGYGNQPAKAAAVGGGPLLKPDYLPGQDQARDNQYRPATPAKYKPADAKPEPKPDPKPAAASATPAPAAAAAAPAAAAGIPPALMAAAPKGAQGLANFMPNMPTALAAYAGWQFLTKNADKAKEWTDWFKDLQDTPDEINDLSDKASSAKDTITQIQELLKARPDLLEGDSGKLLKEQIEESIKSTDKALGKMTKMLAELSSQGAKEGNGDIAHGIEKYWNSYRYKDEWEGKVKASDAELQKELAKLGALTANVYSRALTKPAPASDVSKAAASPPAVTPATATVVSPPPVAAPVPTTAVSPPPNPPVVVAPRLQTPPALSPPYSPPGVGTAEVSSPPAGPIAAPAAAIVSGNTRTTQSPTAQELERSFGTHPVIVEPPSQASPPTTQPSTHPPPSLVAAAAGASSPEPEVHAPIPRNPTIAEATLPLRNSSIGDRPPRNPSIAQAAVADMTPPPAQELPPHRASENISPLTSPPRPSSVAREEAEIGSIPAPQPSRARASSAAVPPVAAAYVATPPPDAPNKTAGTHSVRKPSTATESADSLASDLAPQDILLDAAWDGRIDAVAHALRRASVNACDLKGHTALHLACERDHLAVAILLLDRGADPHARADGGRMPLHMASRFATADTVEMLLDRAKADPNARTAEGRTPLHYAASAARDGDEERRDVIRVLRDWGADPTLADRRGKLPRDVAQSRDHWDAASTLRRAEKRWEEEHKQNWLQRHNFLKK